MLRFSSKRKSKTQTTDTIPSKIPPVIEIMEGAYDNEGVDHVADFDNLLSQGIICYIPRNPLPLSICNKLPAKINQSFIFVLTGFLN